MATKKPASKKATAAPAPVESVKETAPSPAPAPEAAPAKPDRSKKSAWVSFSESAPPSRQRFIYCRQLEGGSKVAAFAEVSASAEGSGLWIDGVSGIQPMPEGDGHWWMVIELP